MPSKKHQFMKMLPSNIYEFAGGVFAWILFAGAVIFLLALLQIATANPWLQVYWVSFYAPTIANQYGFSTAYTMYWLLAVISPKDPVYWTACWITGCPTGGQWSQMAWMQAIADYASSL